MRNCRFVWVLTAAAMLAAAIQWSSGASANMQKSRRVVPVINVVPNGAAPFKGDIVKVEVIEAVDIVPAKGAKRLKVAVQIRNARGDRVRCSLQLSFDGEQMGQPFSVDLSPNQSDLEIFSCYCGDGHGADQLVKLTAEAKNIKIGD